MFTVKETAGGDGQPLRYGQFIKPEGAERTGRAVWFVPGLGGSVKGAIEFLEALLPHFDTIYGPDLRGFGLNPVEKPLTHFRPIHEDLDAFYRQVIEPAGHEDLTLIGISLGGVLSTLMAAEHPERFNRMVLLAPAYKAHAKSFSLSYLVKNVVGCMLKGRQFETTLPYGIDAVTSNENIIRDPQYHAQPPLVLTAGFLLDVKSLTGRALKKTAALRIPTLMVIPGNDVVCCPEAMRAGFARIPESTPKVCYDYPDYYHDVLFEAGNVGIAEEVAGWVGSHMDAPSGRAAETSPVRR